MCEVGICKKNFAKIFCYGDYEKNGNLYWLTCIALPLYQIWFVHLVCQTTVTVRTWMNNYISHEITYVTRSTPRAQTSAMPSLKSVKQSTEAWNSVAYYFLCQYPENIMNTHPSGIPLCCQQTRTQKIKKEPFAQGVKPIIPKMFQIVPCVIANISWRFHENPLIYFTVVLLTNTPGSLDGRLWNTLGRYATV